MRPSGWPRRGVLALCLLWAGALAPGALALEGDGEGILPASLVTPAVIEAKIAEVEAATDLTDEARSRLVELYRKALSNLEAARADQEAAERLRRGVETAPAEIQAVRAALDPSGIPPAVESLDVTLATPLPDLEQALQKEQADLAAVNARRADFTARLALLEGRPAAISQRLSEANQQLEKVAAELQTPAKDDTSPALIEARRWVTETRYLALSTEIKLLDQELLSRSLRMDLLKANRDKEQASAAWIDARVKALMALLNAKRQQEADLARTEAERLRRETQGLDPLLTDLAEGNADLSARVNELASQLQALDLEVERIDQLADRIRADHQDAREMLASDELTGDLGAVLLEQRDALPDLQTVRRIGQQREEQIAESNVRRLRHRAEARRFNDLEASVAALEAELRHPPTPALRALLRELVRQRQEQIENVLEADEIYLAKVRALGAAEDALLAEARAYDRLLVEYLLWLRSAEPTGLGDVLDLPDELRPMFARAQAQGLARTVLDQLLHDPLFWIAVALAVALLWRRGALVAAIQGTAIGVGKPTTDSLDLTLRALALTLILNAAWPLLLAAAGWRLQAVHHGTDLSHAFGDSLTRIALHLYILRTLDAICRPRGLAAIHFRWPPKNLELLRREIRLLTWVLIPAALTVQLAIDLSPANTGGTLARLGFLVGYGALSWFLFRVFHPRHGVMAHLRSPGDYPLLMRAYLLWYPLVVLYPLFLVGLAFGGYMYTAAAESVMLLHTLWFVLALVLFNAFALRWLQLTRRRLAYQAALDRRRAALETARAEGAEPVGSEAADLQFEEPEVDLAALSDDTRRLIRILVIAASVLGLYLIWADALPALRVLDDVALWHQTVTVDGEQRSVAVTLANLGTALLVAIGTWILAARLPAVLEMVLLRHLKINAASRYTVITLSTYVIVAVGVLVVLSTLGARWSQLQWLAAGLTVGIGFGLQEIVANFISGLIILFERPIRVGDTITVGDTDGVVTKIRIRATTIRNWDRKELLVPNKEFITGRLLNWSLSDPVTRIVLVIGVAYGSDVDKALALMREIAEANEHVVDDPAPYVTFDTFGDNALTLTLRAYVDSIDYRVSTITDLNLAINREFARAGISIAFPQRDVHLDTTQPFRVRLEGSTSGASVPGGRLTEAHPDEE